MPLGNISETFCENSPFSSALTCISTELLLLLSTIIILTSEYGSVLPANSSWASPFLYTTPSAVIVLGVFVHSMVGALVSTVKGVVSLVAKTSPVVGLIASILNL